MTPVAATSAPQIHWIEGGQPCTARWRSERGHPPPKRVQLADDTLPADTAYRLACEGTALLWRGDFQNARHLLQALARRNDRVPRRLRRPAGQAAEAEGSATDQLNRHRMAQAQRARILGALLIPFNADHAIPLRRAPDARQACAEAWPADEAAPGPSVASLRELLGIISAHEWRKKGVEIPLLAQLARRAADAGGQAPYARIHPHYGVFSPVRGEYLGLVAKAALPNKPDGPDGPGAAPQRLLAFDIGTGTGVLAALLARRGVGRVVATDLDPRALACAADNLARLGVTGQVTLQAADLYPPSSAGRADLIVCNPPWLPGRPSSPLEHAVYDEGSRMLRGFLDGLAAHLAPGGEGWLILSDLAEHLGLRTRAELMGAFERAGLQVLGRLDARPQHPKASDASDPLHAARSAELTSLWRLAPRPA
jgi:SAM-dependent methyltransferase